jgi:MSHA biogenesis protein MshL
LIEAKILEVELEDEFTTGINWTTVFKEGLGITNLSLSAAAPALTPAQTSTFTFAIDGADIDSTVQALNRFGTVRALASPRLSVMNNQSAALNVARNQVFFSIEIDEERDENGNVTNREISSEIQTVPVGIVINVMPVADPDTNEVIMSIRPSITRADEVENDPAVAFLGIPGVVSEVPVVDVREIDTMVKMRSGEVAVIGGLIQDRSVSTQEGIPVASDVPILGMLFRNQGDRIQKYELVVLLRAVILDGQPKVHPTDKYLYKNFSTDRRPFKM